MKTAIIHDWLNGMRGGEKVLEAMLEVCPGAAIFTLFHERGKVSAFIESHKIVTSWLDRFPFIYSQYRNLLPLFPYAARSLDLSGFDLVISSSHAAAKGIRSGNSLHICYCHTPMRYVWDAAGDYGMNRIQQVAFGAVRSRLQRWDQETSKGVDYFVANSRFVKGRIREYYGRDAEVIHPPIDVEFFTPSPETPREDFYVSAGALVPYKRFDLIVEAFNTLGQRLVIAGDGPELRRLRQIARSNVDIRGRVSDEQLRSLYRRATAMVFAAREDFGMVTIEAQACGCPVIALNAGGSAETVEDGVNGIHFARQSVDDVIQAIRRFESLDWTAERVRQQTGMYSRERFKDKFRRFIEGKVRERYPQPAPEIQPA